MEELILFIVVVILAVVVISPILSIVALVRTNRVRRSLEELRASLLAGQQKKPLAARAPARPEAAGAAAPEPSGPLPPPLGEEPALAGMERAAGAKRPRAEEQPPPLPTAAVLAGEKRAEAPAPAPEVKAPAAAARRAGVEESLGVKLPVWIGAVALALAGVFLVKYTFDKGLLTPTMRVALGSIFGAVLLVGGEALRGSYSRIGQGLSAAGIADLYACLLGAVNLYKLLDPTVGSAFLILVTATAVLLSLRQGPVVAVVGLVGGFLMPALIHTEEPRPAALFSYLLLLEVGLVAVTGKRRWWWLAALALLASMAWAGLWVHGMIHGKFPADHGIWVGLFLLLSAGAFVFADRAGRGKLVLGKVDVARILAWAAVLAGLTLVSILVRAANYSVPEWLFLGVLATGCIVLGRLDSTKEGLAALSALAALILLAAWHAHGVEEALRTRFGLAALGFGALHAGGGYICIRGSRRPAGWAILSVTSAIGYFLVAYWEVRSLPSFLTWGTISMLLATLCLAGAIPIARRRGTMAQGEACLAVLAVGTTAFISLAVPLELKREWITVAWALEVAALAWLEGKLRLAPLRYLAGIVAGAVLVRLLLNPAVLTYPIGEAVFWNWILYGYGVPIVALVWAAGALRRSADDLVVRALEAGAVALGFAFILLQVRQYFHPAHLERGRFYLAEWASFSIAWLLYAVALLKAWRHRPRPALLWGGAIVGCVALVQAILCQGLAANPLIANHPVGETLILNALLYAYGAPALLAVVLGRQLRRYHWKVSSGFAIVCALLFLFALVSLEVRQGFRGSILVGSMPTNAEWYAYSAAWIALGTALLIFGIVTRGTVVRYASLVVMLLAVLKVFLYDTRELRDLYRVISFLGLGASLLFLAFLYQRFVFRRRE